MEENEYFQELSNPFLGFLLFVIMQVTILERSSLSFMCSDSSEICEVQRIFKVRMNANHSV